MKTNWQDPQTSEIRSTHIAGLQEAVGKIEDVLDLKLQAETNVPLTEVYISEQDRYRIYQAPAGKRNWASSPAPVIKKNGVVISSGFTIDYGGGAIIVSPSATSTDTFTADVSYTKTADNALDEHKADYESLFITNADAKNSIYRGKYLGSAVTAEQYAAISSGTFTDLYIGDYWTIGGVNYRIAAFDYYYNTGDTPFMTHHAVIVPDTALYNAQMNDTNTTTGGYTGSKMYTTYLASAITTIKSAFSEHVLNHRKYLCNTVTDGKASAGAWFDSSVDLMNEVMVYGTMVNSNGVNGLYNIGVDKSQLPLFRLNPKMINIRQNYWLRDVVSASHFALVGNLGTASYDGASSALGVRPAFSIS